MRVGRILAEPFLIHRSVARDEIPERVAGLLRDVGLKPDTAGSYPHELSGGQRQRVGIARALAVQPALIVADEAVSSLDVSVQMQVLNVLLDIRQKLGLALMFITHNIAVVEYLCDRVVVLAGGEIVESGATRSVIGAPQHAYTQKLIEAVPRL
jgi:ABC-type glutathione transport system ATPase component